MVTDQSDEGVKFVDRPICLDPGMKLWNPRTADQGSLSFITGSGIDLKP